LCVDPLILQYDKKVININDFFAFYMLLAFIQKLQWFRTQSCCAQNHEKIILNVPVSCLSLLDVVDQPDY